jgi:propanediol dehydratase large subunit
MLTSKQEQFCQNIVKGMSKQDAYKNAYNTTKCSEQTISNEAYKLLLRDDIQQRIDAIKKPLIKAEQITILNERTKQIEFIKERIELCKQKDDEQSIIRYTEMLNKIYALYKENENEQKDDNKLQKLDTDTLIKLTSA